jgi:hypothetical protein
MDIVKLALKLKRCEEVKIAVQQQRTNSIEEFQKLLELVVEKEQLKREEVFR